MKSNVRRGWHPVAGALAVCTLAFAVSVQGAPRENSRGLDKVKSNSSRLVTSGDQMNQLLDGGVAGGSPAFINLLPENPENGSTYGSSVSITGNTITVPGNMQVWLKVEYGNWGPSGLLLRGWTGEIESSSYGSGVGAALELPADACNDNNLAPGTCIAGDTVCDAASANAGAVCAVDADCTGGSCIAGDTVCDVGSTNAGAVCADNSECTADPGATPVGDHTDCEAIYGPGAKCPGAPGSTAPHFAGNGFCRQGWQDTSRLGANVDDWGVQGVVKTVTPDFGFANAVIVDDPKVDDGSTQYGGSLILDIPIGALGTYNIGFKAKPSSVMLGLGGAIPFVLAGAVIEVPDGQCCDGDSCLSADGNEASCPGNFDANKDCGDPCSCLGDDLNCNDGDRCTEDICNVDTCSNPTIEGFNSSTQCCDTGNAAITDLDDGDGCTTDSCTESNNRGSAQHPISSAGIECDDGNACFVNDVCDGTNDQANGGCFGTDANTIACTDSASCEEDTGAPLDCDGGFCFCTLSPDLGFVVDGEKCVVDGDKITMAVHVGAASNPINGGQFVINYDPTCLDFNSISPAGNGENGNPYTQEIAQIVDEAAGTIFYAVGVDFGGVGAFGNVDLAVLSFTKLGGCADCTVCFGGENPINTYLTDADGQQVGVTPSCSNALIGAGVLGLNVPDSVKTNSDCSSPTRTVLWDAPSSSDTCGGATLVCEGLHRSHLVYSDAMVQGGGEIPQGDSGFSCCAVNECGEEACEGWTITVNDQNTLDVTIQMSPTMRTKPGDDLTRCIKFEVFNNCIQGPLVFEQDIHFGGLFDFVGKFTDQIKIPDAIQPHCITARDQKHSLRSCYLFGASDCVDGILTARFSGDPLLGGNWLTGGNLDGWKKDDPNASHDVIDILDFGQFVAQYNATYDSDGDGSPDGNTPCGTSGAHADINGDGIVDILDFSFVSMNFLEDSKDCCCPAGGAATQPRTSVTVRELRQMGMNDLIGADLNSDGVVDLDDMAAFLNGDVPVKNVRGSRSLGR